MSNNDNNLGSLEDLMDPETLRIAGAYALATMGISAIIETPEEEQAVQAGMRTRDQQLAARELVRRLLALDQARPELGVRAQLKAILDEARLDPYNVHLGKKLAPIVASVRPYLEAQRLNPQGE